jgi:hypothetical protein
MRRHGLSVLLLLSVLGPGGLAAVEPEERRSEDTISAAIQKRIDGKASAEDVILDVVWPSAPDLLTSYRIYGNGVGVYNRRTQFRLTKAEVMSLLKAAQAIRIDSLPLEIGESEKGEEREIKGRVTISVGGVSRAVRQVGEEVSEPLSQLAATVLRVCEKPAQRGITVGSFDEAFRKLDEGALVPEVFEVVARRKTDHPGPGVAEEDWMVRVNGRHVLDRVSSKDKSPAVERELTLSDKEFRELVALVRASTPASLPQSLYATQYTGLHIQVLNQVRNIQARQFTGMAPTVHGERQKEFDRIVEWGAAMHQRALTSGQLLPARPALVRESEPDREREKEKPKLKD